MISLVEVVLVFLLFFFPSVKNEKEDDVIGNVRLYVEWAGCL